MSVRPADGVDVSVPKLFGDDDQRCSGLTARGYAGIVGAIIVTAMLLAYIIGFLPDDLGWLPGDIWIDNLAQA